MKKICTTLLKVFLESRIQKAERVSIEQYNKEKDDALIQMAEGNYPGKIWKKQSAK